MLLREAINAPMVEDEERIWEERDEELLSTFVLAPFMLVLAVASEEPSDEEAPNT